MLVAKVLTFCLLVAVVRGFAPCKAGWRFDAGVEQCICNAGYSGLLCNQRADICNNTFAVPDTSKDTHFPVLDMDPMHTYFSHNNLYVSVLSSLVRDRRYVNMSFIGQTDMRCSLGTAGSFWTRSVDADNCEDAVSLEMPWTSGIACGFQEFMQDLERVHYKGTFGIDYEDQIFILDDPIVRHTSVHYDLYVSFNRIVAFETITLPVHALSGVSTVLTETSYDPQTEELTLGFVTIVNWPIKVNTDQEVNITLPNGVVLVGTIAYDDTSCPNTQDKPCKQVFTAVVKLSSDAACSFDGNYTLITPMVSCRDADKTGCPQFVEYQPFGIKGSSICGKVSTEVEFTYRLAPMDQTWATDIPPYFSLGAVARFSTLFSAAGSPANHDNIIRITYTDASYQDEAQNDPPQVLLQAGDVQPLGYMLNFKFNHSANGFSFDIRNDVFKLPIHAHIFYNVFASGTISLDPTRKREVEYYHQHQKSVPRFVSNGEMTVFGPGGKDAAIAAANAKHNANNNNNDAAAAAPAAAVARPTLSSTQSMVVVAVGSVAVGCILVAVVVAVSIIRKKVVVSSSSPASYSAVPQSI